MKNLLINTFILCIFTLVSNTAFALTITNSSNFTELLNDGAFITDNNASPSNYTAFLSLGNESGSSDIAISGIPIEESGGIQYFSFIYTLQETGAPTNNKVSIDDIIISYGGQTIWELNGDIVLNNSVPYSLSAQGNGGDMELFVPVSPFYGFGLTGNSLLTFYAAQSESNNGPDRWATMNNGAFFVTGTPIGPVADLAVIPEPSTFLLLGGGLVGLAFAVRRRRKE